MLIIANEVSCAYHNHAIIWRTWQAFAPRGLALGHPVEGAVVAGDLSDVALQLVVEHALDADVGPVAHRVHEGGKVDHASHGNVRDHAGCQALRQGMGPSAINLKCQKQM